MARAIVPLLSVQWPRLKLQLIRAGLGVDTSIFHATCGNGGIRPRLEIRITVPACRMDGGSDGRSIGRSWLDGGGQVIIWQASALTDSVDPELSRPGSCHDD